MLKKLPDTFIIIFFLILIAACFTWFVPGGEYQVQSDGSSQFAYVESQPQSWQVFTAFQTGFSKQASIIIFVLIVGGVFWIINASKAIDVGIFSLLNRLQNISKKGHVSQKLISQILLAIIMLVFSIFGAVFGMSEETLAFVGIIIPLTISMGYDSLTGVSVCFVAAGLGFAGAVLNPFTIGIAQGIAGLPLFSGLEYRLFCWLVINVVGIIYILRYASIVHKTPKKSPVYKEDKYWRSRAEAINKPEYHTPIAAWIVFFACALLTIVLGSMKNFWLTEITIGKSDPFKIPILPILGILFLILGGLSLRRSVHFFILIILTFTILYLIVGVMGYDWYINEISGLFLAAGIITGIAMNKKGNQIVKLFMEGARDILGAAVIIGLAGGIIVILEDGKIIHTMLHKASESMKGLGKVGSVGMMYVIQTALNIIIPSGSAKAAITMPIMAPFSDLINLSKQATVMAFQFGDGFTNMITPTSPVLIGVLGIARIPFAKWFKWALPMILLLTLVGFLLLIPTVLMELNGF